MQLRFKSDYEQIYESHQGKQVGLHVQLLKAENFEGKIVHSPLNGNSCQKTSKRIKQISCLSSPTQFLSQKPPSIFSSSRFNSGNICAERILPSVNVTWTDVILVVRYSNLEIALNNWIIEGFSNGRFVRHPQIAYKIPVVYHQYTTSAWSYARRGWWWMWGFLEKRIIILKLQAFRIVRQI